jgi:hypothetical protein
MSTNRKDSYDCDNSEDVEIMINVKTRMDSCHLAKDATINTDPNDPAHFRRYLRSIAFRKILKEVNAYLFLHCRHNYVEDDIDIDPDRSQRIKYCDKCLLNFE